MNDSILTRREWLASFARLAAGGAAIAAMASLRAERAEASTAPRKIVVYKDPDCGCCKAWVTHLATSGFAPEPHDRRDMDTLKDGLGVPPALRSCHTAVIGRYVIEGHVPAADIKRLLARAPKGVVGLAVPGMPAGAPGMEMGARVDRYQVMAFTAAGSATVFASHG